MSDVENGAATPSWPLQPRLDELEAHDLEDVRGTARLGTPLQFEDAPRQLERVIRDLRDLKLEDWDEIPLQLQNELPNVVAQLNSTIDQMKQLTSAAPNASQARNNLQTQLSQLFEQFRMMVQPYTVRARIREEVSGMAGTREADEQVTSLQATIRELQAETDRLRENLNRLTPVAEAQREVVGESGAAELSEAYAAEAADHASAWHRWLWALSASVVVAIVAGLAFVALLQPPDDATNAEVITAVARDLLFVGLLLYAVRITSLQFRVHRHLEAVSRNKAAALRTFNRVVTGQTEAEVRAVVAAALAHAVFASDQTGFIGAAEDHVTLVERIIGPASHRATGS